MGLFDERTGGLVGFWKSKPEVTSILGGVSNARIWPHLAKQGTVPPYLCFIRAGGRSDATLLDVGESGITPVHAYCYGRTMAEADMLAKAVKRVSRGSRMRGLLSGGIRVMWCFVDMADDGVEQRQDGSDEKDFYVRLLLRIQHDD